MTENDIESQKQQVIAFLKAFKLVVRDQGLILKEREKNREGLKDIGFTQSIFISEVLSLSLTNYSEGPILDQFYKGEYWVFGKMIGRAEFYIKLKIAEYREGKREAICLSFHKAEWPIHYPFGRQAKSK